MKKLLFLFCFLILAFDFCYSQNVGIGTSNPAAKLHVAGSVRMDTLGGNGLRPVFTDSLGNITATAPSLPPSTVTNAAGMAIPDFSCTGATSIIAMSQLPASVPAASIKVTLNITHPKLQDLTVYLTAANGNIINLFKTANGTAANLVNTVFTDAGIALTSGNAPYTGYFRPAGDLTPSICGIAPNVSFFTDMGTGGFMNPNGTWTLKVIDNSSTNTGTLNNWTVSVDPGIGLEGIWGLKGNAGTNQYNFIGTTDNAPLNFKVKNRRAGIIDSALANTALGFRSLESVTLGYGNSAFGNEALLYNGSGYSNIAIGNGALKNNVSGNNLVAVGDSALFNQNGGQGANAAMGSKALYSNTTGYNNTALGSKALFSNTTGYSNTATGGIALYSNTTGTSNTASGYGALRANTTGNNNTATGGTALYSNTTGFGNTATGGNALAYNTTGAFNTATGTGTLYNNTTGELNTATGYGALYYNTTGLGNTATGFWALVNNTTGATNTASGYEALRANTTGANNTASGYRALYSNTTGANNTATGVNAHYSNTTGVANTATGSGALYSNTTGVGNTASGYQTLYSNTTGNYNTATGFQSLYFNTTGAYNTATGNNALSNTPTSQFNTAIGYNAGDSYNNGYNNVFVGANTEVNGIGYFNVIAIGLGTICTASSQATMGNSATGSYRAYANWSNISDGRYKKNVQDNVPGLNFITQLRPVTYNLDATGLDAFLHKDNIEPEELSDAAKNIQTKALLEKEAVTYSGFVAQEVEAAARQIGFNFSGVDAAKNENDVYGLRYAEFVVPLVKAVQEQQVIIEKLKKQVEVAEAAEIPMQIGKLQKMIEDLQKRILLLEAANKTIKAEKDKKSN